MLHVHPDLSSGLPELDQILRGLLPGDNVVWQVAHIEDYLVFVEPFCRHAMRRGRRLTYFRFARHQPLIGDDIDAERCELEPQMGFEAFLDRVHATIERAGRGAFYVFDCLSDLAADWFSDQMLGNFFKLTCPYLYDLETITYFALLRNYHSSHATIPIRNTTQLLLDVYSHQGRIYLRPLKATQRYSPTMHWLHVRDSDAFRPVRESHIIAQVLTSTPNSALESAIYRLDVWNRAFLQAEAAIGDCATNRASDRATNRASDRTSACAVGTRVDDMFRKLLRMVVSRDERVLALAERYFDIGDVLEIGKRTIGTGLIGGKAVGMLLARAILERSDPRWRARLEMHDSFYIASDVFYTFLVHSGCWWARQNQKNPNTFLQGAEQARQRIMTGTFPDDIVDQFSDMLDYFGRSPIIVRSSSLLEDNFGNSFAGKYVSVFCPNQGSRVQCLEDFLTAVKTVYASTMSEDALAYRARHNILHHDEQMALLVQRVSGSMHNGLFYPHVAGVGLSFNPYVWSSDIDSRAGMLRLVFGLGTRAVDRADDDYTRLVALNAPERRPEAKRDHGAAYAQQKVDVIDLEGNQLVTADYLDVLRASPELPTDLFAMRDPRLARERGLGQAPPQLTFDTLLSKTSFVADMRDMLRIIEGAYDYPVDIEFTANFQDADNYKVNLVQCRPLQVSRGALDVEIPAGLEADRVLLRSDGPVIGRSRIDRINRIIHVCPAVYGQLPLRERYAVARLIGRVTRIPRPAEPGCTMLLGPGRWGTTTPSLGVPVSFAEINTVSILCEIVAMRDDLVPDVSLGTHFFSELVEMDILYLAFFPQSEATVINWGFLEGTENALPRLLPDAASLAHVVRVIDAADLPGRPAIALHADTIRQQVLCHLDPADIS